MSTFTAYLDDQDLILIQKGEEHILPFYLKTNQGHLALIPVKTSSAATDTGDYFLSLIHIYIASWDQVACSSYVVVFYHNNLQVWSYRWIVCNHF